MLSTTYVSFASRDRFLLSFRAVQDGDMVIDKNHNKSRVDISNVYESEISKVVSPVSMCSLKFDSRLAKCTRCQQL